MVEDMGAELVVAGREGDLLLEEVQNNSFIS